MELTQKTVETALYEGRSHMSKGGRKRWSQHVLWDDGLPGFGLRISPTHRKSYIVSYRDGGRKRTKTLGRAGKLKLDEARGKAAEFLDSVGAAEQPPETTGQPPIEGVETVAQLADAYLENHLKNTSRSWFADQRLMRTHIKPAMGRLRVGEVTRTDLTSISSRVARRFPADARRMKPLLNGMFDWAAERGMWSRSSRKKDPTKSGSEAVSKPEPDERPEPEPLPSAEELAKALLQSEEERRELVDRLEEVSSSGAEMLVKLNQQASANKELEGELASARRELQRAQKEAATLPDPAKAEKQTANLKQSVEQLMASLQEAEADRAELADKLAVVEAKAGEQAKNVASLTRSRNELEDRIREEERTSAMRKVQRRPAAGRPRGIWLAAGAIGGILLTLLLQGLFGRETEPSTATPAGEPTVDGTDQAIGQPGAEVGEQPATLAESEPATTVLENVVAGPDFTVVESAVRSWAAAWSEQRVDDYLAAYSEFFQPPDGLGRGAWESQRRNRILRPASIQVTLADLIQVAAGPDRARVSFEQSYETRTYADQVRKTLELEWEDGSWKIVAELAADP